jgi:hypothetical protein
MKRSLLSTLARVITLGSVLTLLVAVGTPAEAASTLPLQIDFGTASMTPAVGYLLDSGQAYGARTGTDQGTGNTYGWVLDGTTTPLDLSGEGRVRTGTGVTDVKTTTFVHMQRITATPGAWEAEVPDGDYTVTVGVGDAGSAYDSTHAISVEGQQTVEPYVPTASSKLRSESITVAVTDGRLTVRPENGINTKITFLTIAVATIPVDPTLPLKVDFGASTSIPPAGSVLDYGQAYGPKDGNTYGWVRDGTNTPLNLTKNGRQRTNTTGVNDDRLKNYLLMQYTGSSTSGTAVPGAWEMAVRNGTYRVTVAVG